VKALILAAGRGERMRPLTWVTPKPLLDAGGKPLIVWHLEKLAALGVRDVVVNTAWLATTLRATLGDGEQYGVRICYSHEGEIPLETGGALLHARAALGEEPFLLINGDIWTDYDFARLTRVSTRAAHLVMVPNPNHVARGDFHLDSTGRLHANGEPRLTYSGLGVYCMSILDGWRNAVDPGAVTPMHPPRFPLLPLLRAAMSRNQVTGELHEGQWTDVGTPERLIDLDLRLQSRSAE